MQKMNVRHLILALVVCLGAPACKKKDPPPPQQCYTPKDGFADVAAIAFWDNIPPFGTYVAAPFVASTDYDLVGVKLFISTDCSGCSPTDCSGCVASLLVSISTTPNGSGSLAIASTEAAFPTGQGWTNLLFGSVVHLTQGHTYYLCVARDASPQYVGAKWPKNLASLHLFSTYSTTLVDCTGGALDFVAKYPTNTVAAWTTPDDITAPGPHPLSLSYLSLYASALDGDTNLFLALPAGISFSGNLTIQALSASNAPNNSLLYAVLSGTAGMGALTASNLPPLATTLFISTTGTNVATVVPEQSWLSLLGTNGVVPLSGQLVCLITNALYQGPNALLVTLDLAGTYDFDAREADWTTAQWSCHFPTIPATAVAAAIASGGFRFAFQSVFHQDYAIQVATSPTDTGWQLLTNLVGNGSVLQVTDPVTNDPQRFYRLSSP